MLNHTFAGYFCITYVHLLVTTFVVMFWLLLCRIIIHECEALLKCKQSNKEPNLYDIAMIGIPNNVGKKPATV